MKHEKGPNEIKLKSLVCSLTCYLSSHTDFIRVCKNLSQTQSSLMAPKTAEIAIGSIGRGYDICSDIRLKFCKGDSIDSRLIEIDEDDNVREVVLPGGVSLPNVSKLIKCDKGERTRFRSDVLSFQQVNLIPFLAIL